MTHSGFFAKSGVEAGSGVDFCLTGDCDALGIDYGKIAVMSVSQIYGVSLLRVNASDLVDFTTKASSRAFASCFITDPPSSPQPPHKHYTLTTLLNSAHFARLTNFSRPFPPLSSLASPQASLLISPAEQCWIFQTFPSASILLPASPCLLVCQKELSTICDQCQAEATL